MDSASSITSFHFSHFFCFVISFEFCLKRTPFSCFIFCKTASLFAVSSYLSLPSTTPLVKLVVETVTGYMYSKIFRETAFSATCHLSHRHQSTCHLWHQSLNETGSMSSQKPLPTQPTRDQRPCPQQGSNPRSQQLSGCISTPYAAQPPESVGFDVWCSNFAWTVLDCPIFSSFLIDSVRLRVSAFVETCLF